MLSYFRALFLCPVSVLITSPIILVFSGGPIKGGHLKMGFRTEIRTRHVDFALTFALKAILQESTV